MRLVRRTAATAVAAALAMTGYPGKGAVLQAEAPIGFPASSRSLGSLRAVPGPGPTVVALCYHDVSDDPDAPHDTVTPEELRAHVRALKAEGWSFGTVSEVLRYRDRFDGLPSKVAMLTFDDGYRSFREHVLPILREEGVSATLAVVTGFVEEPPPGLPPLLGWDEIREIAASGHVEIASHTHALHRWADANPGGLPSPAATTRLYDAVLDRYEDRDEFRKRIRTDLARSRALLRERAGVEARVLAWPYGEHNAVAREIAAEVGFAATLGLEGVEVRAEDLRTGYLSRLLIHRGVAIGAAGLDWLYPPSPPIRAAEVDLDALYHEDRERFAARVEETTRRLVSIGATDVFLQVCSEPLGDGFLSEAWFMNHQLPVRADVWTETALRFKREGLRVWARVPSLNLSWEWARHPEWRIPAEPRRGDRPVAPRRYRISPDLPEARAAAVDFMNDLAVYLPVDGVIFDDDGWLAADERLRGSGSDSPAEKDAAIREHLAELRRTVLAWRPNCRFARVVPAAALEWEGPHPAYGVDWARTLEEFDLGVVLVDAERADRGESLERLARRALRPWQREFSAGRRSAPILFHYPAVDGPARTEVPPVRLARWITGARDAGVFGTGLHSLPADSEALPAGLLREPDLALEDRGVALTSSR